ncbi:MAG: hypothetical protein JW760_10340 [Spirochaetales bacterium]|nr:hypothetical protein [Spirochaetales bacterium]
MKIVTIKDILKKENHLFYRNDYSGTVVYEITNGTTLDQPVEFSIERSALGTVDIQIRLPEAFDYPRVPALRSLKAYISSIEKEGTLL